MGDDVLDVVARILQRATRLDVMHRTCVKHVEMRDQRLGVVQILTPIHVGCVWLWRQDHTLEGNQVEKTKAAKRAADCLYGSTHSLVSLSVLQCKKCLCLECIGFC